LSPAAAGVAALSAYQPSGHRLVHEYSYKIALSCSAPPAAKSALSLNGQNDIAVGSELSAAELG